MKTYSPVLSLKGARRYVHGTTIYQNILAGAEESGFGIVDGNLSINFRAQLREQSSFYFLHEGQAVSRPKDIVVDFSLSIGDQDVIGWVRPSGPPIIESIPFDESAILRYAQLTDRIIKFNVDVIDFHPIEIIACLAVKLHQTLYPRPAPAPAPARWLLARITLNRPLTQIDVKAVHLEMIRIIGGRFTETSINIDGVKIGSLNFLLGQV